MTTALTVITFILFVACGVFTIMNLIEKNLSGAFANFLYSIVSLVTSIVTWITNSNGFMFYFIIAWGASIAALTYACYKAKNYAGAIVGAILAFICVILFIIACTLTIVAVL